MAHKTILLTGFLFVVGVLSAQNFSFGIRAGYTLSNVTVKKPKGLIVDEFDEPYKTLSSLHAGIDTRISLSERFAIVSGLQYARKGYKSEIPQPNGSSTSAMNELHYLNLPVVADVRLWKGLSLQGGIEAGSLLSAWVKSAEAKVDTKNFYEDFDFGLVAGFEYRFNEALFIGLRHIFGISSIQQLEITDSNGASSGLASSYNRATQISAGYRYTFGE